MKDFFKTIAAWIRITLKPSTTGPMLEMVDRVATRLGLSKQIYHPNPLHWADGSVIYYVCSTELGQVALCSIDTSRTRMKIVFNFVDKAEQSGDDLIVNYAPPEGGELVKLPMLPRKAYIRLAG